MIAFPRRSGFIVVDSFSRIVRLGEGIASTGRISQAAEERALDALKMCAEIIARWEVTALRAVTTEACRSAANGDAFVERVRRETGLKLEVIGPEQEALLALSGCASLIDHGAKRVVLFDIGGGSTEVCFLDVQQTRPKPSFSLEEIISMPFGVVRLSEGLAEGGFAGEHFKGIRKRVRDGVLEGMPEGFEIDPCRDHIIGTSGTATSLAAMHKGLQRYRRREVDGSWLTTTDITGLADRLEGLGYLGRAAQPCIGAGRADLIMPGVAILQGILDATGFERVRVADRGLREGLITELMADKGSRPGGRQAVQAAE
ncbi:Ppx/GppA phosphatase family protein [Parvularcula lutaonensis]|uniref:Ppx/GppA phosphatase family protein n=1 Tax=Parvularcula lutaonensis TaxID=491923 RepID=A0ABV7M729_9PROT|nr:Ppx/GppA phosphatase family protein [Parvularcula lutaonensis]